MIVEESFCGWRPNDGHQHDAKIFFIYYADLSKRCSHGTTIMHLVSSTFGLIFFLGFARTNQLYQGYWSRLTPTNNSVILSLRYPHPIIGSDRFHRCEQYGQDLAWTLEDFSVTGICYGVQGWKCSDPTEHSLRETNLLAGLFDTVS